MQQVSGFNHDPGISNLHTQFIDMFNFKIVPLSKAYAARIRQASRDDFGHEVLEQLATGKGPCRVSLQPFVPGRDKRLLFTHSPFPVDNAFNQPGPVFINSKDVDEYADVYRFPPAISADTESFPISLIGYSHEQEMNFTQLVGDANINELIRDIFKKHPEIAYLHARNAAACCYICTIERL